MERQLVITITGNDEDIDWLRHKVVPAVEEIVDENKSEERVEDTTEVEWEFRP